VGGPRNWPCNVTLNRAAFANMKAFSLILVALVAAAGGWVFVRQAQTNEQLRGEIVTLRDDVQRLHQQRAAAPAAVVTAEASGALNSDDRAELSRLREELVSLRGRTQEISKVVQAAQAAGAARVADSVPVNLIPSSAWKNAGAATPNAAVETVLWAATGGDVDTVAAGLSMTPSARAKADAMFAGLSEATRQQYGTPEKLIALMIAKDADKVTGMQILGQREVGPDDVGMRIRFGNEQGQTKEDSLLLHRTNDGWKLQLNDGAVDKFAQKIGGGK
jgi:hypothetical protein